MPRQDSYLVRIDRFRELYGLEVKAMGPKREAKVALFGDHLWWALPDPFKPPKPKAKILNRMIRKYHWSPSQCKTYYADAKWYLAVNGQHVCWTGQLGLRKARNENEGRTLWKHSRWVTLRLADRTNQHGACLVDDGVEGITQLGMTEQALLSAGKDDA